MSVLRPPADLDARYRPFLSLPAWADRTVRTGVFDVANTMWADQRRAGAADLVRSAVQFAVRAAAFDTGAIEGLYVTDRGVTFSVAVQAAAWESIAQEAGRDAVRIFAAQLRAFDLVLDAVTGQERITAGWRRALHETICEGQDTYRALTAVPPLRIRREAVHPVLGAATRLRIQDWADELLGDALRILADQTQEAAQPIADNGSDR